ncbi:hypothetical protein [Allokutzneria oryzae]|uniref:DUF3558 domain-containing protein n=1 Tax=Allokutzneria oryzae TaxID=1378989 RepID=A0ABV6A4W8_9PSEU
MSEQRSPAGHVMTRVEPFELGDTVPVSRPASHPRSQAAQPVDAIPVQGRPSPADRFVDFLADRSRKGYLIKGLALAGVALLSGVLWSAGGGDTVTGTAMVSPEAPTFVYEEHAQIRDSDCAKHSYGSEVQPFFRKTPCQGMVRWLYATKAKDGSSVVVALAVVTMPSHQDAAALEKLTKTDGTGNVNHLILEGRNVPGGPKQFREAGYASAVEGANVLIAESEFYDYERRDVPVLQEVSRDALRLARAAS